MSSTYQCVITKRSRALVCFLVFLSSLSHIAAVTAVALILPAEAAMLIVILLGSSCCNGTTVKVAIVTINLI